MDCATCREELGAVLLGLTDAPTADTLRRHLADCPECAGEAARLEPLLGALLTAPDPVPMPEGARERLLASARLRPEDRSQAGAPVQTISAAQSAARRPPTLALRRWLALGLGAAAALAAWTVWPTAAPLNLRHADVVISAGDVLVTARSEVAGYPLVLRAASGHLRGVVLRQARPAWYTEGVYAGGRAYLLDAANEELVVLNVADSKVERTYPVPGGAAGLAVQGGRVFVKSAASGELRIFEGEHCFVNVLSRRREMPQAEYMDAVLALPGAVLTTQHTTGQVFVLSPDGQQVRATYEVGGAPVGLAGWRGKVLVLDVQGRLLQLGAQGQIERRLKLPGHPDKLSVMDNRAYLTDRGGRVSVIDLPAFRMTQQRTFGKPMDIVALPSGGLALADAQLGVMLLRADLSAS
ncbi:hypothetical protein DKM44_01255 [Deinococcus irradiatisoli]|uniref:Zinc-finger domain-containing protein n=1 Tax=Deinococcus irradiatisoli TaxID=2202254 RepID=A0A2Z3JEX0_9DEIO|nr:hypothetical protein [Deinococcus irradiatisoli]AWN22031.1 hypothetical protein DKM44_01255 [Deinococcus irradiatisoli]